MSIAQFRLAFADARRRFVADLTNRYTGGIARATSKGAVALLETPNGMTTVHIEQARQFDLGYHRETALVLVNCADLIAGHHRYFPRDLRAFTRSCGGGRADEPAVRIASFIDQFEVIVDWLVRVLPGDEESWTIELPGFVCDGGTLPASLSNAEPASLMILGNGGRTSRRVLTIDSQLALDRWCAPLPPGFDPLAPDESEVGDEVSNAAAKEGDSR